MTIDPRIENTLKALKKHRFDAIYLPTAKEAQEKLLEMIPTNASVGVGGSMTLYQMDLIKILDERGNQVLSHTRKGLTPEEKKKVMRGQLTADVFIAGSNAVTETGEILNMDAVGNRVAAMIYGPDQVILVVGINKIVPDLETAKERIRSVAGPINAQRLKKKTPCTVTGQCQDCNSEERLCNVMTILNRKPWQTEICVMIVGEELGF
jgi:L-lactate utilization protein LutB